MIAGLFFASIAQEEVTITAYYPTPAGTYQEVRWGDLPNNRSRGSLNAYQGASIDLGGLTAAGNPATPYIDFHNDMNAANDFDARIILEGDNSLMIRGITRINTCVFVSGASPSCPPCYFTSSFLSPPGPTIDLLCCLVENPPAGSGC